MIKIVTAIYSNLYNTKLGGRDSRQGHYLNSLRSLLKMSNATFVCYTSISEIDILKDFFYVQNNFNENQIIFKTFDLQRCNFHKHIQRIKDVSSKVLKDRCYEIQYSKFIWCLNELTDDIKHLYWFDAGLSHTGLIPFKYLDQTKGYWEKYFESSLFNNNFLNNLIDFTEDKIVVCAKDNKRNYWSTTLPKKYYSKYISDRHIIGGFFGGKKDIMKTFCDLFTEKINEVLVNENELYLEENIMSLLYYNNQDLFTSLYFDIWWHEEDIIPGVDLLELTKTEKSFYKILENLN